MRRNIAADYRKEHRLKTGVLATKKQRKHGLVTSLNSHHTKIDQTTRYPPHQDLANVAKICAHYFCLTARQYRNRRAPVSKCGIRYHGITVPQSTQQIDICDYRTYTILVVLTTFNINEYLLIFTWSLIIAIPLYCCSG